MAVVFAARCDSILPNRGAMVHTKGSGEGMFSREWGTRERVADGGGMEGDVGDWEIRERVGGERKREVEVGVRQGKGGG